MTRQPRPSALESAVHRWVEAVLAEGAQSRMQPINIIEGDPAVSVLSADAEAGVLEIGSHLGNRDHFREPGALAQFLYDSLATVLQSSACSPVETARVTMDLLQRLASPLQRFRFRAPLALRGELSMSGAIGGPNELSLESSERQGHAAMSLAGVVDAPTEPMAIVAIEEILETVLGACLTLDLCLMLTPLPGASPTVCVHEISPHDVGIPTRLRSAVAAGIAGAVFRVPDSLTELERRQMQAGHIERGLERHGRYLSRLMASSDERAVEMRRAATLYLRASVSVDLGLVLTHCFMCLEGVLLERSTTDNVLGRLSEAVAYRIGTSSSHRAQLRREVKDLYEVRSRYVHTGQAGPLAWSRPRERCLEIVGRVLRREIEEAVL